MYEPFHSGCTERPEDKEVEVPHEDLGVNT